MTPLYSLIRLKFWMMIGAVNWMHWRRLVYLTVLFAFVQFMICQTRCWLVTDECSSFRQQFHLLFFLRRKTPCSSNQNKERGNQRAREPEEQRNRETEKHWNRENFRENHDTQLTDLPTSSVTNWFVDCKSKVACVADGTNSTDKIKLKINTKNAERKRQVIKWTSQKEMPTKTNIRNRQEEEDEEEKDEEEKEKEEKEKEGTEEEGTEEEEKE